MNRYTALCVMFGMLLAAAVKFYQPVEIGVYDCSEHPEFTTRPRAEINQ